MTKYKMIRGLIAEDRCTNKSEWGSPLYCNCGCQIPRDEDPKLDLSNISIGNKTDEGYANVDLMREGQKVGQLNTQYLCVFLDDHEFLECEESEELTDLLVIARKILRDVSFETENPGTTIEESISQEKIAEKLDLDEQDNHNENHAGYCQICHTFCYGDCTA